jgi:valyl-tRNA synthetase
MPFVTEEVWQYLAADAPTIGDLRTIMYADYPTATPAVEDVQAEADFSLLRELIVGIRNLRSEYKVEPARLVAATIVAGPQQAVLAAEAALIARLARVDAERLEILDNLSEKPAQAAAIVIGELAAYLPLAGMVDIVAERTRLAKELQHAEAEVQRREGRLANPGFVEKAPEHVVQRERDGLVTARAALEQLRERIAELGT